mmetsp:Transcript_7086/g.16971  ORF Transcript_7086/g.16971 Transcript_7086/m.16971 type:complete len:164 (+) Transcript_7086:89-580(+)|eukprot:CAMPEP_0181440400 /NCGR_PEP_ID=MMETSP1110-20121109/22949_1 /TAXON_ID=174948 /ORGANISM="Symbiodinium sp., Strain CCMP421" /LENGTH=163 /DNA_ID=CAMNT_0023564205 /DNA_START=78 /DNA_END=569 /DNA_ORIENTATION=-
MKVYSVTPIISMIGLAWSAAMVVYPFYLLFVVGEELRIIHISHFLQWCVITALLLFFYPRRLELDEEGQQLRYVLTRFPIPVPLDQIIEVRALPLPGYVLIRTSIVSFAFRPTVGAESFLADFNGLKRETTGAPSYGALADETAKFLTVKPGSSFAGPSTTSA